MNTEINEEMDFDFDNLEMEYEVETAILLYEEGEFGEQGELIQRFVAKNLVNMSINYEKKVLHAEHKNGNVYDINFYKMVVI